MISLEANCPSSRSTRKVTCFSLSRFRGNVEIGHRKSTGINLVKRRTALRPVASGSKAKEQLLRRKPKLSKQRKVASFLRSQGFKASTPEIDAEDIGYYRAERCAKIGDEYDSEYPYLTSSGEDSDTGNDSPGTRERCRRVPRIGFPTVRCATAPGVPKWKGFLRGIESVYPTGTGDVGDEPGPGGHGGGELSGQGLVVGIGSGGEASGSRSSRDELRP